MIDKPLESIIEEDLQLLVKNSTREKRHLEYKRQMPSDTRESKIKFPHGMDA